MTLRTAITVRRGLITAGAAGAISVAALLPTAMAEPPSPAPAPAVDCSAAGLSAKLSSVTKELSTYFAAHPDANQALIDATRLGGFSAMGAFNAYFNDHPQQADEIRAIKQPLADYKNACGMQVEPAEALVVIADL